MKKKTNPSPNLPETKASPKPNFNLIVVEGFNDYRRGDLITDSKIINEILNSSNERHVHKVKGETDL